MYDETVTSSLHGWHVLALRPSRECSALRRRLAGLGATLRCVAPWRIECRTEQADALRAALQLPLWVVTSPNAVRCAAGLADLSRFAGLALAVGPGTARALRRAGVGLVRYPEQAPRSEGLLQLPELAAAERVALVTGEGGRGLLDRELAKRGTRVERVEVYRRVARPLPPASLEALRKLPAPRALLLSSVEALDSGGARLAAALRGFIVVAASERVAAAARERGLHSVAIADSAAPSSMLTALQRHAKQRPIR